MCGNFGHPGTDGRGIHAGIFAGVYQRIPEKTAKKWGYGIAAAVLAIAVLAVVAGYWWFVKSTHVVDVQTTISDAGNVGDVQSIPNLLQEDQEESE